MAAGDALRWRCRRGMRELDLILERFLDEDYPQLADPEREAFARLLELEDERLAAYLIAGEPPREGELSDLVARIRRRFHLPR